MANSFVTESFDRNISSKGKVRLKDIRRWSIERKEGGNEDGREGSRDVAN